METVEVLVRIPKKEFEELQGNYVWWGKHGEYIKKGTVLPKGHGDLKDMNDLCYKSRYGCKGHCEYLHICNSYGAPTIIEADKESE